MLGDRVQFQVRDASTASDDLRELIGGESAAGALVLTSIARGLRLFGDADHDAGIIDEALDGAPLAGVFCGSEVGPVGGTSFAHTSSATVVLFG
jgi:small ligand-binding sensory domain FIST